jgi:hypothetical protein
LHQISNHPQLYPHFTEDDSLREILRQIILNPFSLDQRSMLHLQECLRVVINNASSDVRYSIANIGMQVTASYFQLISSPLNEQDL